MLPGEKHARCVFDSAHVSKLKRKLLALEEMTAKESEDIHKTISELRSMPHDVLFKVDAVEKLLQETSPAYHEYSELMAN